MRSRPSALTRAVGAVACTVLLGGMAGCEARVYGAQTHPFGGPRTAAAPSDDTPSAPVSQRPTFEGLAARAEVATTEAAGAGADITVAVLDRDTGELVTNGHDYPIAVASVVKLFIADDLLLQVTKGQTTLTPDDRELLDLMLRSSDDSAAEVFWNRSGGSDIIDRVTARYGLDQTHAPANGRWYNTISTVTDLVHYYDMLLSGRGGLPASQANIILGDLASSTPTAPDGMVPGGIYPQRFGIPEGLYSEPVAVKQGWMCCIGADWMHLSTGVIGADRRYVMAISSMQAATAATARATITEAVATMFPGGRI